MDINAYVGNKITLSRDAAGLSRDEFAAALGISASLLEAYETGKERVLPEHVLDIAGVLKWD
jgi:transcriptional regulator with XRE-family HTH domain